MQKKLGRWTFMACAAGAVAATVLFLNTSLRASAEARAAAPKSDWQVECGADIQVPGVLLDGDVIIVKVWVNLPAGSHDDEIAALMADQTQLKVPFVQAAVDFVSGQFQDMGCGPCENPNTCFIWVRSWDQTGAWMYSVNQAGNFIWIEAHILTGFLLHCYCTGC